MNFESTNSRPPLVLLVGFLGAGKTTFLERVIPEFDFLGRRPHVILNDYQNASVDAARLATLTKLVQPIHGSCVCCGSRDELLECLARIDAAEDSVVLVEANGTTDAEELVEMLAMDARAKKFSPPVQVAVIDASRWQKRLWHNKLEAAQVKMAAYAWITRMDAINDKRRDKVEASLATLNRRMISLDPQAIAGRVVRGEVPEAVSHHHCDGHHVHDDECTGHHHAHAHHHFASAERALPDVVDRDWLARVVSRIPAEAVRVKGICYFEAGGVAHLFQRVEGETTPTIVPLEVIPTTSPVIILIGSHLPMDEVDAVLREEV